MCWLLEWCVDLLTDVLIDQPMYWLIDSCVGLLISVFIGLFVYLSTNVNCLAVDWSTDVLIYQLMCSLICLLIYWLICWLVGLLIDRLMCWLVDWLLVYLMIDLFINWFIDWSTNVLIDWSTGVWIDWLNFWRLFWFLTLCKCSFLLYLSTNCFVIIRNCQSSSLEGNYTYLEVIMKLAGRQTALSLEYPSPAETSPPGRMKTIDTQSVIVQD